MRKWMPCTLSAMGIRGSVRSRFHGPQRSTDHRLLQRIFKASADHRLMIDLHGAYPPDRRDADPRPFPDAEERKVTGARYTWHGRGGSPRGTITHAAVHAGWPDRRLHRRLPQRDARDLRIEPRTPMVQTTRGLAMYVVFDSR
jgi:alpha-glucosidase